MIKPYLFLLLFFLCSVLIPGKCFSAAIGGTVFDSDTLSSIADVTIKAFSNSIEISSTSSDSSGNYLLTLTSGVYDIQATKPGYFNKTYTSVPAIVGITTTRNIDFTAIATGTLSGKVIALTSALPLSNATIEVSTFSVFKASATTDSAGNYSISITTGTFDIQISAEGYATQTKSGVSISKNQTTTENISLTLQTYSTDELVINNNVFDLSKIAQLQIEIRLSATKTVSLKIIDSTGKLIKIISEDTLSAGKTTYYWNSSSDSGQNASSGVYMVWLKTNNSNILKKIVLLR